MTTLTGVEPTPVIAPEPARARGRARAIGRYLFSSLITLLLMTFIAFLATSRSGETVARNVLGKSATPEQLDAFVKANGLDRPVVVRYVEWLWNALQGDWGTTLATNLPVQELAIPAFVRTAELAGLALLWSLPVAILLGMVMARRKGAVDMTLLVILVVLAALPEFVIAIGVLLVFAVQLQWLPVDAAALQFGSGVDVFLAHVPAALTLGIAFIPYISRITRATMAESLAAPYTRAAVLRGLPRRRVIWGHAMRTASVPLVNAVALVIIYAMGGVIVVENIFGFPGLGRLLIQAITQGDTNVVLVIIMLLGSLFLILALIADLIVVRLNPRLKAVS